MSFEVTDVSDARASDFQRNRTAVIVSVENALLDRIIETGEIDEADTHPLGEAALRQAAEWRADERIRRAAHRAMTKR